MGTGQARYGPLIGPYYLSLILWPTIVTEVKFTFPSSSRLEAAQNELPPPAALLPELVDLSLYSPAPLQTPCTRNSRRVSGVEGDLIQKAQRKQKTAKVMLFVNLILKVCSRYGLIFCMSKLDYFRCCYLGNKRNPSFILTTVEHFP